jgi:hypothetical protein
VGAFLFCMCADCSVTGAVYVDMFEELPGPFRKKRGPDDLLFKQYRASLFSHCSAGLL